MDSCSTLLFVDGLVEKQENTLFYVACFVAVGFVLFGAFLFFYGGLSQGESSSCLAQPDKEEFLHVYRADLVGEYSGWTEAKTRELLNCARGKVLFIDKAYNLVSEEKDSFSKVALTAINKLCLRTQVRSS